VLAFEQEDNVDQMVKYATHFLAKRLGIEQLVNSFVLLFSDNLDQRNNLC
jgi:hypothetical protein